MAVPVLFGQFWCEKLHAAKLMLFSRESTPLPRRMVKFWTCKPFFLLSIFSHVHKLSLIRVSAQIHIKGGPCIPCWGCTSASPRRWVTWKHLEDLCTKWGWRYSTAAVTYLWWIRPKKWSALWIQLKKRLFTTVLVAFFAQVLSLNSL